MYLNRWVLTNKNIDLNELKYKDVSYVKQLFLKTGIIDYPYKLETFLETKEYFYEIISKDDSFVLMPNLDWPDGSRRLNEKHILYFKTEEDIVLFKLKWM